MDNDIIIVICPHCEQYILIYKNDVNCAIFRHAVYKNNYIQINPHMSKEMCDKLAQENQIIGCGKPFRLVLENNEFRAIICDYI